MRDIRIKDVSCLLWRRLAEATRVRAAVAKVTVLLDLTSACRSISRADVVIINDIEVV